MINSLADNRLAHWWNLSPTAALAKGVKKFGDNVLVESGPSLIEELLLNKALDGIYLSITAVTGGENPIDIAALLGNFVEIDRQEVEGTQFIEAKKRK
jgi:riboflavin biosynthesis pyrimidine reductase